MSKHFVLVLNHFAVSDRAAGGTRHVEMFGNLGERWTSRIIAADRNLLSRERSTSADRRIRYVRTSPYRDNGIARIVNWASYALAAFAVGVAGRRPDVVYASSPHLLAGLAGLGIARIRRSGFIFEVRDLWPQVLVEMGRIREGSVLHRTLVSLEHFLYRSADAIVVLAEASEPVIREIVGRDKRIEFVPNGADVELFSTVAPNQEVGSSTFVYAGAHGPANGLDLVLDAAAELQARGDSCRVVFVGDGVSKVGLVERWRRDGLANVEFRDAVPKSEIPVVLAGYQVGLHVLADVPMFRYAVSPNKVFEYMAAGLPVITNTPGTVADLVEKSGAGIATDPDGLAVAMRRMVAMSPEARVAMGANGRQWVTEHRSRRRLSQHIEWLLDDVAQVDES